MTTAPMIDVLTCDRCGDDLAELREIKRNHFGDEITCAACFSYTREAAEMAFTDFDLAQETQE